MTFLLGLTLAATIVAACSTGAASMGTLSTVSPGAPSTAPTHSADGTLALDGKTYLSTDATGVTLVPGSRIRLTFKDGSLGANGGCNLMSGAYTITADRLTAPQMAMTEMACAEPLMQQDQWLARLLGGATIALVGDTLTLDDGTIRLMLKDREVASPDKPIEGTQWILDGIVAGDAVSSVPAGVTASMRIKDGRLDLNAGCNIGGGSVTVTDDTLAFGPIGLTKRACERGPGAVEAAVLTTLAGTVRYTIEADVLTVDGGDSGLTFRAAPSP